MIRVPIVHRQFASVIKFVAVDDDLRLQFCRQARSGMKLAQLVHRAIVRRSDIRRHLVGVRVLAAVEPDVRLGPRTHYKDQ